MTAPATRDQLLPAQIADLRALADNPHHFIQPVRRLLLKRLQLIRAIEPPHAPGRARPHLRCRAHELTAAGRRALARHNRLRGATR